MGPDAIAAERAYQLWLWLEGRVVCFPRHARPGVGVRLTGLALQLMEELTRATYAGPGPTRRDALTRAQVHVGLLRYVVRGAVELRWLSLAQGEHAQRELSAIGAMANGWLQHARAVPGAKGTT